jgi:EAL domain-containing protein (putative c-di-GMP-specific phosphodiesterase class I)
MQVCAEGVETPGQLDFLRAEGCQLVQGFLLARPGPDMMFQALGDKSH